MRHVRTRLLHGLERLEDRRMMTGDVRFANGVITIDGAGYHDEAEIRFDGHRVYVDLEAGEANGGSDHDDLDRSISDVLQIVFNGFDGDDELSAYVDELDNGVSLNNIQLLFDGGAGDDAMSSPLRNLAWGGDGDDVLHGGQYGDTLYGGAGNDELNGRHGDDWLFGGAGDDLLIDGFGNDLLLGEAGNDELLTMSGNDSLNGGADNDQYDLWRQYSLDPSENVGDMTILDSGGVDTLDFAAAGSAVTIDLSVTWRQTISLDGLTLLIPKTLENVVGSHGDDVIRGNSLANILDGLEGHDTLEGRAGDDTLRGGEGDDRYLFAGAGLGADAIDEEAALDRDTLDFSGMTLGLTIDISRFGASYAVNVADLRLSLSHGAAIEDVVGTNHRDRIVGNSRENRLYGGLNDDFLTGDGGADQLYGEGGNDTLRSDALDLVFGGTGDDWFDEYRESLNPVNPRPARYRDWGRV